MQIYIKNMVSSPCVLAVQQELAALQIKYSHIELGRVDIDPTNSHPLQLKLLNSALRKWGFEILETPEHILVEKIKSEIISLVYYNENDLNIKLSYHLSKKISLSYRYLSHIFKKNQGFTLERFFISHKIRRVKELNIYNQLSLTEIAFRLNYSSLAHLSNQFKKVTGITFSEFKLLNQQKIEQRETLIV